MITFLAVRRKQMITHPFAANSYYCRFVDLHCDTLKIEKKLFISALKGWYAMFPKRFNDVIESSLAPNNRNKRISCSSCSIKAGVMQCIIRRGGTFSIIIMSATIIFIYFLAFSPVTVPHWRGIALQMFGPINPVLIALFYSLLQGSVHATVTTIVAHSGGERCSQMYRHTHTHTTPYPHTHRDRDICRSSSS